MTSMMDRRAFITIVGGSILAVPLGIEGQQPGKAELLKELVPSAAPVAVLWTNATRSSAQYLRAAEAAACRLCTTSVPMSRPAG